MIKPIKGSDKPPANRVPLRHAVDYLRQHYAVELGVDNMAYCHLGGTLQDANEEERDACRQVHTDALERARAELPGCLSAAAIPVWRATDIGSLEPCDGAWASKQLSEITDAADIVFFAAEDWERLVPLLTLDVSREYFAKGGCPVDVQGYRHRQLRSFKATDAVPVSPWWNVNQALSWIATRIPSYVEHVGTLAKAGGTVRHYIVQAGCEADVAASDEGQWFGKSRRSSWPEATVLALAGRELLRAIISQQVTAFAQETGKGRRMAPEEFAGTAMRETAGDWLDMNPQPQFSSDELMRVFPPQPEFVREADHPATSTVAAESECRAWLENEFKADPERRRSKEDFRKAALALFNGRLSARGFDHRVWPALAQRDGRSAPGAKRKS